MAQFCQLFLENAINMVSLDDFRLMTYEKKCDLITFSGSYLTQRTLDDCNVFLYQSNSFFIEVFYSARHKRVLMINAFDKVFGLEPYLEEISLEELIA